MNDMIIRVTENKREVGILKTSSQIEQASPIDYGNMGKDPENKWKINEKRIELIKCCGKLRDFNGISPRDKETASKPDTGNNEDTEVVQQFHDFVLNKNIEIGAESPKRHIEPVSEQTPMELDFDSELENKSDRTTSKFKQMRNLIKEINKGKTYLKPISTFRYDLNKLTEHLNNSDSSDEESKQNHPNRRLQPERPDVELPTKKCTLRFNNCLVGKEEHQTPEASLTEKSTIRYSCLMGEEEHQTPEADLPTKISYGRNSCLVGKKVHQTPEIDLPTEKSPVRYSCLMGEKDNQTSEADLPTKKSTGRYNCLVGKEVHQTPEADLTKKKSTRRCSSLVGKEEYQGVERVKSTVVTVINNQYFADSTRKRPRELTLTRKVKVIKESRKIAKVGQEASKMWENIIDCPHLWEGEKEYVKEQIDVETYSDDIKRVVNYKKMLNEFLLQRKNENKRANSETFYEKRVKEMFKDADSSYILKEFYIPPAIVELFYLKTAPGQAAVDSLQEICRMKKWPEPTFACVFSGKGFLYSCTLKTETFVPTKTATNEELAKELAALECLQWLGLEHSA